MCYYTQILELYLLYLLFYYISQLMHHVMFNLYVYFYIQITMLDAAGLIKSFGPNFFTMMCAVHVSLHSRWQTYPQRIIKCSQNISYMYIQLVIQYMLTKLILVTKHKYNGVFENYITDYYIFRYKSIIIHKIYPKIIE